LSQSSVVADGARVGHVTHALKCHERAFSRLGEMFRAVRRARC
jgi:hypothetical protein